MAAWPELLCGGSAVLVQVHPEPAAEQSPFEVGFSGVDLRGGGGRGEDLQDAELEVLPVPGVDGRQLAEGDVPAVAVPGVLAPAAKKPFGAVGLAHVQPAVLVSAMK